jgi:cytochrome c oxidase subunit IV
MSEHTASVEDHDLEESHTSGGTHHPSDATYIKVALILAGITGIEVALYYLDIGEFSNAALLILSALKFAMVAMFFMHLRFDSKVLRRFFITGIVLASLVYCAYMLTLGVFIS